MVTASIRNNQLNFLAGRSGYNLTLRHFRTAQEFSGDVGAGFNLADLLNETLAGEHIEEYQIRPVVNILLADKYGYAFRSENLRKTVSDVSNLCSAVETWTNIQIVLVYTDTNGGIHLLNPEQPPTWWEAALPLAKDELIACYAGALEPVPTATLESAVRDVFTLLYGKSVKAKSGYQATEPLKLFPESDIAEPEVQEFDMPAESTESAESAEQAPVGIGGSRKLTAKLAVNVTNELFHNGNVESWKRVIESYRYKYPHLDVLIWYEGERINDINALFKWGKVKHGVPIMFSVAGDNPAELSKLKKYLFEGASPRFEAFLHGVPGSILQLF